jgi:DNA-directed RNA polymerase subunit RPC12/RpoP
MYKCKDCGEYFADPNVKMEDDTGYREATCPWCDSDDIEETFTCIACGNEWADSPGGLCPHCMDELAEELSDLAKRFDVTAAALENMICEHYGY